MRSARRLTALLVSFLFAHLLWAGSGFACTMPTADHGSGAAMAGMEMPGDMAGMDMGSTTVRGQGDDVAHHHAPCESPSTSDDCQTMTPCAPLALASVEEFLEAPHAVPSFVTPVAVLTPPSRVSPPESPPPRA
ncbi:MAG: hypothetical protein ABR499_18330 [Gemmatimonadaceae bacterium]